MSAEGDAVQQLMPQDALMQLLRQQGVQPTPANVSRAAQGMIAQEPTEPPAQEPAPVATPVVAVAII